MFHGLTWSFKTATLVFGLHIRSLRQVALVSVICMLGGGRAERIDASRGYIPFMLKLCFGPLKEKGAHSHTILTSAVDLPF